MRQPRNLADEDDFEDAELDAEHQAILDKLAPLPREQSPNVVRQPKASDLGDALGARLQQQLAPPIPTDPELDELNELFAVVTIGANVRIMTLQESPPIFYHLADFKLLLGNRTKQVTEADNDGQPKKKTILTATWWLKHPNRGNTGESFSNRVSPMRSMDAATCGPASPSSPRRVIAHSFWNSSAM
jgi:hypothetical protein